MSTPTPPTDVPSKPRGRRGKELTPVMRARICELRSIGWTYKQIQEKHPTIAFSTIVSTCRREHDRVDQKSKPRSGAPRKITEDEGDQMVEILKFKESNIKLKDLRKECENAAVSTVKKLMSEVRRR
ncbi:hypothetical protein V492_07300 [Pseudogymnoascus sp. VKM F-4246]|nr:hypothetical protein V492_07300 [Pseudogymnoascus sp. VKM F-4246]